MRLAASYITFALLLFRCHLIVTTHVWEKAPSKLKTYGQISSEMEVNVPASEAWDLYASLKLIDVVVPDLFKDIQVLRGDGGVGTILNLTFYPGAPFSSYEERIIKVDEKNMVKVIEVYKGGFLDVGFNLFWIRWDVIKKSVNSCITKVTIEFDVKEEYVGNISYASILPFISMMKLSNNYLIQHHKTQCSQ